MDRSAHLREHFDADSEMSQSTVDDDDEQDDLYGDSHSSDLPTTGDGYPATQLVKELLIYVSAYELGRHVNLSRQLNTRSRATYDALNQLITNFINPQQNFKDIFRDFDTSSKVIPVLERSVLFSSILVLCLTS
jgi:hypothetical protein